MIRNAVSSDAAALAEIYNHYVLNTVVTFEEEPVSASTMAARLADVQALGLPWLVFEEQCKEQDTNQDSGHSKLLAYAYATRWKPRSSYRFSVEITVYAAPGTARRGLGSSLYAELFQRLRTLGVHAAVGGIALPNEASVALHEKFGMTQIGQFREIGFKAGRWIDVGYWQLIL